MTLKLAMVLAIATKFGMSTDRLIPKYIGG